MHELPPSSDNNNDELFGQLADLGLEDLQESIDWALEEVIVAEENLRQQQLVIQQLKEKHPILATFLKPFTAEAKYEMYETALEYRTWLLNHPELPDDIKYRTLVAEAICTHIWKITDVLAQIGDKTDTQVVVITDDVLPPELKTVLLEVLHELVPMGGIDVSDPDEVQKAINQHHANQLREQHDKALRKQLLNLFHTHEHELLKRYAIHISDPIWSEIRAWSSIDITRRTMGKKNSPDIFISGIRERLAALRINESDYLALIAKIEGLLEE